MRSPLSHICIWPDAQKKTNNCSPIAADVIKTVLHDGEFWTCLAQLIKTTKPLVDVIGNIECHEASLADCMLKFIWCVYTMTCLELDDEDNIGFWLCAKSVFNQQFHSMNMDIHSLAPFLHPMYQKLVISQGASGKSFEFMIKTALGVVKQWKWKEAAQKLVEDMKQYCQCKWKPIWISLDGKHSSNGSHDLWDLLRHKQKLDEFILEEKRSGEKGWWWQKIR